MRAGPCDPGNPSALVRGPRKGVPRSHGPAADDGQAGLTVGEGVDPLWVADALIGFVALRARDVSSRRQHPCPPSHHLQFTLASPTSTGRGCRTAGKRGQSIACALFVPKVRASPQLSHDFLELAESRGTARLPPAAQGSVCWPVQSGKPPASGSPLDFPMPVTPCENCRQASPGSQGLAAPRTRACGCIRGFAPPVEPQQRSCFQHRA